MILNRELSTNIPLPEWLSATTAFEHTIFKITKVLFDHIWSHDFRLLTY